MRPKEVPVVTKSPHLAIRFRYPPIVRTGMIEIRAASKNAQLNSYLELSHFLNEVWLSPDGFPANKPSTLISSSISSQ